MCESTPEERGQARLAAADVELEALRLEVRLGRVTPQAYEARERQLYEAIMIMNGRDRG